MTAEDHYRGTAVRHRTPGPMNHRLCQYPACPRYESPLVKGERSYHKAPCKTRAKRLADCERQASKYGDGLFGKCKHCHKASYLTWSEAGSPVRYDPYLMYTGEAVLCSVTCLVAYLDANPGKPKPEAYYLAMGLSAEPKVKWNKLRVFLAPREDLSDGLMDYMIWGEPGRARHDAHSNTPPANQVT